MLNCTLGFAGLSSRNLDGIFRAVQLLLSAQHSRDLWKEPMRSSCAFTRLASANVFLPVLPVVGAVIRE